MRARGRRAQALAKAALRDAAFAVAAGDVEKCVVVGDPGETPLLTTGGGVAPGLVLADVADRLHEIAALPFPLSPYRDRVVAAGGTDPSGLPAPRREIVAHATGRHSARDIAFAVGRGLHPVTVEISRMFGEELLEIAPLATAFSFSHRGLPSLRPRVAVGRTSGKEQHRTTTPWPPNCGNSGRTSPG